MVECNTRNLDGVRWYECTPGEWYPSVTSILKVTSGSAPALTNWRRSLGSGEADAARQQALDRGTAIHEFVERRLRGYRVARAVPSHLRPYWDSLAPVLRRCKQPQVIERFVWHREQRYAGTLDAVCRFGGVPTLVDWKTTSSPKYLDRYLGDYRLQVTAYAAALLDTTGVEVRQCAIVVAHPDGPARVELVNRQEMAGLWDEWRDRCAAFTAATEAAQERQEEKRTSVTDAFRW